MLKLSPDHSAPLVHAKYGRWVNHKLPELNENIKGIKSKNSQTNAQRRSLTIKYTEENFPSDSWTYLYTDWSVTNTTDNNGGGVFIVLNDGEHRKLSLTTRKFSSSYTAETEVLKTAAVALFSEERVQENLMFLTDVKKILI